MHVLKERFPHPLRYRTFVSAPRVPSVPPSPSPPPPPRPQTTTVLISIPFCFLFEAMNNPPPPPWKKEDKYDNTHLLDERTEDQRNANDFLELIELGSLRVRTTQLSGLPDECSLFPSPAICSTMDLIPPRAFIGNVPTSGFQGPMGFAHPTSRVIAPIFKDLLAKRVCLGLGLGRPCRGDPLLGPLCTPWWQPALGRLSAVSSPPVCGCLSVSLAAYV